jgi:Zn-dependent protease with chaperone function
VRLSVYAALVVALVLAVSIRPLTRRLPPAWAAGTLVSGALLAAATWTWCLVLLASTLAGQIPLVASVGRWSGAALSAYDPVRPVVALAALIALVGTAGYLLVDVARVVRQAGAAHRAYRLPATADGLVVVDDARPAAMAVPGWRGRVVVTSAMLRLLSPVERRIVLAHERAHLHHGHAAFRLLTRLAACQLPALRPCVPEVDYQLERWADEAAAHEVGDRRAVATTLARVALLAGPPAPSAVNAAFHRERTSTRVLALLAPVPPFHRRLLVPVAALAALAVPFTLEASHDLERLFELAKHLL